MGQLTFNDVIASIGTGTKVYMHFPKSYYEHEEEYKKCMEEMIRKILSKTIVQFIYDDKEAINLRVATRCDYVFSVWEDPDEDPFKRAMFEEFRIGELIYHEHDGYLTIVKRVET